MAMEVQPHCWDDLLGPEERLVARSYVGKRTFGSRPALLLIDLYQQVFGDRREPLEEAVKLFPASCGPAAWDAIDPIRQVLASAREAGIPIAHATGESRPEARIGGATLRRRDRDDHSVNGYKLRPEFRPDDGEYVVYKTRASAFFGTPLSTWLRLQGADSVVVCGETTSGCVRASVVDAYSDGLKVLICEEGVFDRSPLSHKMNLFDMHHKYATVLHLEGVVAHLRSTAGTTG